MLQQSDDPSSNPAKTIFFLFPFFSFFFFSFFFPELNLMHCFFCVRQFVNSRFVSAGILDGSPPGFPPRIPPGSALLPPTPRRKKIQRALWAILWMRSNVRLISVVLGILFLSFKVLIILNLTFSGVTAVNNNMKIHCVKRDNQMT